VFACALAGCSFDPRNHVADGHAGAPGVRQTLLCPLNMVVRLQPEVRKGIPPIDQELQRYLASRDQLVSRLDRTEGRELWRRAVVASKSAGDPTHAPQVFVDELAETREFDVVVIPSLVVVQTRIDANISEWDGVRRVMRMSHPPVIGLSPQDAASPSARGPFQGPDRRLEGMTVGKPFDGLSGEALVTSLHILVYSRDGGLIFEGRGGIDFLQEIEFVQPGKSLRYRLRPNGALFVDESILSEAVVEAFSPYLSPADA
jgi:hypothetical protein